jgi:hypothetical protein
MRACHRRGAALWKRRCRTSVTCGPGTSLRGAVTIGVEAETRPNNLQVLERSMNTKRRDSKVDRMVLLIAGTARNRSLVREHVSLLRQTFPLDTRATLEALGQGRDPGADGLVVL